MANRKRVLSIEIGNSLIKVVEMDYKAKNPKVYRCLSIKCPEDVLVDGILQPTQELINALSSGLTGQGITTKQVIFTVTSPRIASREVQIPNIKRAKIDSLIKENAMDYFPIDLTQYEIGYHLVSSDKGEATSRIKVMALAVPKTLLESYQVLAAECGLEIVAFDYGSNSIYQILQNEATEDVAMVIKVDGYSTNVIVLNAGEVALQRTLAYGVGDVIDTMMGSSAFGNPKYREAVAMFRKQVCINAQMAEPSYYKETAEEVEAEKTVAVVSNATESAAMTAAKKEITLGFNNLISGILRVMDYYNSRNAEAPITRGIVTGLAGDFLGLDKLLESSLELPVVALTGTNMVSFQRGVEEVSFGEYIGCLGAVMDPVGLLEKESKGSTNIGNIDYTFWSVSALVGGIVVAVLLSSLSILRYNDAKSTNAQLEARVIALQPAQNVYDEYVATKAQFDKYEYFYDYTVNPNEQLVAFINELEEILPSSFYTNSFSSDKVGISVSVTVEGKVAAATTIANIRNMESIADVAVSGINETTNANGETMVTFSITGTYREVTTEEE